MFIEQPDPIPMELLEGTNYQVINGTLRYVNPTSGQHIPAAWVKCEYSGCQKIAPAVPYNKGKYCCTKCAYADRKLDRHANWTGGRSVDKRGYVRIKLQNGDRPQEHRHVMEQTLGRKLEEWEHVHHIDGNPSNNKPENLEIWEVKPKMHPSGVRKLDAIKLAILELPARQKKALQNWLQDQLSEES